MILVEAQDNLQQMVESPYYVISNVHLSSIVKDFILIWIFYLQDGLTSDSMTLSGYYGTQQNVQGLVGYFISL